MDEKLGRASVEITADLTKLKADMNSARSVVENSLKSLASLAAGYLTFQTLSAGLHRAWEEAGHASEAMVLLTTRIKSTGGAAGQSVAGLKSLAEQLQKTTIFGDDNILAMQSLLMIYTNIKGDVFVRATRAILDMSKSNEELAGNAQLLGRALENPAEGMMFLRRAGIILNETQKEQIKHFQEMGEVAKAQGVLLDILQMKFGGTAEALRATPWGEAKALANSFGDMLEGIGNILGDLVNPALKKMNELVQQAAKATDKTAQTGLGRDMRAEELEKMARDTQAQIDLIQKQIDKGNKALNTLDFYAKINNQMDAGWEIKHNKMADTIDGWIKELQTYQVSLAATKGIQEGLNKELDKTADKKPPNKTPVPKTPDVGIALAWQKMYEDQWQSEMGDHANNPIQETLAEAFSLSDVNKDFKDNLDDMSVYADQAARNIQDAFAEFFFDPFHSGLQGLLNSFRRMAANMMASALMNQLKSLFSTAQVTEIGSNPFEGGSGIFSRGGVFSGGQVMPYARGGVVSMPTLFPMARGMGLMGEGGPEAVMPLTRTSGGELGVKSKGGGIRIINVWQDDHIDNYLQSSQGERSVLNVISRNSKTISRMVAQ